MGENVVLNCTCRLHNESAWSGPKISSITKMDKNEEEPYTAGLLLNPKLHDFNIDIIGNNESDECSLVVKNISDVGEGNYTCEYLTSGIVYIHIFTVHLESPPNHLTFLNTLKTRQQKHVRGIEGHTLNIECTVNSGKPQEVLYLKENGLTVKSDASGKIAYTFVPSKKDNMKSFECSAVSATLERPLTDEVILDIQYKTSLTVDHPALEKLTEYTSLEVCCKENSNPPLDEIAWTGNVKSSVAKDNESCMTFNPIYRTNTGRYTRVASNSIGTSHLHIDIKVNSPPIFISTNRRVQLGQYGCELNITAFLYSTLDNIQLNISNQNKILQPRITHGRVHTHDLLHGVNVTVSAIRLQFHLGLATENDFANYSIEACNKKGCNTYTVNMSSAICSCVSEKYYYPVWQVISSLLGGILILSICLNIHCLMKRKNNSEIVLEISPEGQYYEIGPINDSSASIQGELNNVQEAVTSVNRSASQRTNSIISSFQKESSSKSSVQSLSNELPNEDGYENPYQTIDPESIEMHPYSIVTSQMYQNTIIFPKEITTAKTKHAIQNDKERSPWLIIYKNKRVNASCA